MAASIGGVAGYIGSLMVTKRMALMAGALGHLTLPGVSLALIYGFDVSIGALLFLAVGIITIWILGKRTHLPLEALTAVVFSTSLAVAFLFLPQKEAFAVLIGDISHIPYSAIVVSIVISLVIFLIVYSIMPKLILSSISIDLATVEGYNVSMVTLTYLICIAIVVAMGVRIVGGLMTAALVSIPACASSNFSKNLSTYTFLSLAIGIISSICGIIMSILTGIAAGPLIIIISGIIFVISLFFKK